MLGLGVELAEEAAATAMRMMGLPGVQRKPDDSVVTQADHAIQARIISRIRERYPDHAIIAEESREGGASPSPTAARFTWVVDPLDGTRNYAVGFPCHATSIAVLDRGEPVVGVIHEHNLVRTYAAIRGRGATVDRRPLRRAEGVVEHDHLIGISSTKDAFTVGVLRALVPIQGLILRNLGSAAMHLALTASGGLSAAFGVKAKIWDLAAGAVIVAETGGRLTGVDGVPMTAFDLAADPDRDLPFVAGSPTMHARLLQLMSAV